MTPARIARAKAAVEQAPSAPRTSADPVRALRVALTMQELMAFGRDPLRAKLLNRWRSGCFRAVLRQRLEAPMPFCPSCRSEFLPELTRCQECDVTLVEALPESVPPPDFHWVELSTTGTEAEGEMLAEMLEARGIPVIVKKDVFASGFGRQGTLLMVPARHRDEAWAITAAGEQADSADEEPNSADEEAESEE